MCDSGREHIHTHRAPIFLLNQFEKKAVGAADFQQASAGPHVASDDAQMVAERFFLRGLVRNVIDVFAPLEVVLLVELNQLLRREALVYRHQTALATDHESFPAREPIRAIATGAGGQVRILFHGDFVLGHPPITRRAVFV